MPSLADSSLLRLGVLVAGALLSGYLALAVYAWFFADHLIYHPETASTRRLPDAVNLRTKENRNLTTLFLPRSDARYTIWVFHGNAEGLGDSEPFLRELQEGGFNVFAFDYPGYGYSGGRPSERSVYAAMQTALDHLRVAHGIAPDQIIAYGRSLGGGPAVELARQERLAGLILQSAFASAFRVVTHRRILPFDQYDNLAKLPQVDCPVLLLHGTADEIVPYAHAQRLHAVTAGRSRLIGFEGAGHNNLREWAGPRYWTAIREFCADLGQVGRSEGRGEQLADGGVEPGSPGAK